VRLLRVTPARPQAGDIVRVYGLGFDAIDGNPLDPKCAGLFPCSPDGTCPTGPCVNGTCPCSMQNPAVQQRNRQTVANRIRIKRQDGVPVTGGAGIQYFYPDAVTPTMLAFRMPFDSFAPLTLEVVKHDPSGNPVAANIPLCDPKGCRNPPFAGYQDRPAGYPCDDGSACTVADHCDGEGRCLGGSPLVCDGPCLACERSVGCVPTPATASCGDGDACTTGDHCSGDANECVSGGATACGGQCQSGACDSLVGCLPKPSDTPCSDGDVCTVGDHCSGESNTCLPGAP